MLPSDALIPAATPRGDTWARLWRFAASDRLALLWLALIGLSLLLMAALPQAPAAALDNPAEFTRWLATVRPRFGSATALLLNLGLLNVSHTPWFRLILAGAAFSLLVRLYNAVEALRQARALPNVRAPDSFFADPQPNRIEQVVSAPPAAIEALAAQLRQRGYRVRTEAGAAAHYLAADRPLAPLGPALAHVGLLVVLLGAAWNAVSGWEQAGITLPPGETVTAGRGSTYALRLEGALSQEDSAAAQIAMLANGAPVAQRSLTPGATWWFGGTGVRLTSRGPAVQLSGSDDSGAPVMLLAAPGATPAPTLTLLVTADRPDPSAFAPAQALALQAEARGASTVRLRALRGTAGELVAEDVITGQGALTVDEVRYQVSVAPYVTVDLIYLPGRLVLLAGGALAALGLLAWAVYRPRRLWALAATEGRATVVKIATHSGHLPALDIGGAARS